MKKKPRVFVCDFETTVYEGQTSTEVWASACVELYSEDVQVFGSIGEQFEYFESLGCDIKAYYHNLKFDGSFWLWYFIAERGFTQALVGRQEDGDLRFDRKMRNGEFSYSISDMGQWYSLTYRWRGHTVELRDSLKLLPFSVKAIGESFKTRHKKLEMEYTGYRYPGCEITPEERRYIENDVLVVKEALETMYDQGHTKLTIGSCCLDEFKKTFAFGDMYDAMFPNVYEMELDPGEHRYAAVGEWVRKSYHGGWCYLVKGREGRRAHGGTTADVNSLYPSMMHSESGNRYPVGEPTFWTGNRIPEEAVKDGRYWFVRVKTRFYLKPGYLPCIQIKGNPLYRSTEWLESSDVYDYDEQRYLSEFVDERGNLRDTRVEMTWTMTDHELIREHYDLVDFEILDGCWFRSESGIFDAYIDKYRQIKMTSKGAVRQLAKLFLNNLYGKLASSTRSSFKVAYLKDDLSLGYRIVDENDKEPGYIPAGAAVTSYARAFTIRAAQANYHGPDAPGFIYADTDSIHCDLPPEEIAGIKVHDSAFCCWKLESQWDEAVFVRQKTYMEHVTGHDGEPCEPSWDLKCAGMPERCKQLFVMSMNGDEPGEGFSEAEREFVKVRRTPDDFAVGLKVPGKLRATSVPGGTLLVESTFELLEHPSTRTFR